MDIVNWLHDLGLQQYGQAFREGAIDASVLSELTVEDLKDIGVDLVGHRRKLLAAISAIRLSSLHLSLLRCAPSCRNEALSHRYRVFRKHELLEH